MTVFVDTSAIVALLSAADARHADAVATWETLRARRASLLTTDLVIAEAVVVVRSRAGFEVSVQAGERLLGPSFEVAWADRPLFDEAWRLYRRYDDHVLSLCDCVSFAVMRRRGVRVVFAYDEDFAAVGFTRMRSRD